MKTSPRHHYHGEQMEPQRGLHGVREPVQPSREPKRGERCVLLRYDARAKMKSFINTMIDRVDKDGTVTLLQNNALIIYSTIRTLTWSEERDCWFYWG